MLPFVRIKINLNEDFFQHRCGPEKTDEMKAHGTAWDYYDRMKDQIDLDNTPCPFCGRRGCLSFYESYPRKSCDFAEEGKEDSGVYRAIRVMCDTCCHTNAFLTQLSPPYRHHSYETILTALLSHYDGVAIHVICDGVHNGGVKLSATTLYQWIHQFEEDMLTWLGTDVVSQPTARRAFLLWLLYEADFDLFLALFFTGTGRAFLQTHRTPVVSPPGEPSVQQQIAASTQELLRQHAFEQMTQRLKDPSMWRSFTPTLLQRLLRHRTLLDRPVVLEICRVCLDLIDSLGFVPETAEVISYHLAVLRHLLRQELQPLSDHSPP